MPAVGFTPPRQWEDWCSWGLGIWLCLSPWILHFDLDATATHTAVITGVLVILAEVVTLSVFSLLEEWINVLLGVWLVAAPWILAFSIPIASANFIVVGVLVLALGAYEIWRGGPSGTAQT
jgi:SPW repeat